MILTKGDVIVDQIKIGDVHYEFEYNFGIETRVLTMPMNDGTGYWTWTAENVRIPGKIITYGVREGMAHYAPNIYTYKAYRIPEKNWI
jgi:hypothetical protein